MSAVVYTRLKACSVTCTLLANIFRVRRVTAFAGRQASWVCLDRVNVRHICKDNHRNDYKGIADNTVVLSKLLIIRHKIHSMQVDYGK